MSLTQQQVDDKVKSLEYRTQLWINNEFVDAADGTTFATENPATGAELAQIAHGKAADVDRAVAAARASYESGAAWRRRTARRCCCAGRS